MTEKAVLVLADGSRYTGLAYGAVGRTLGEAVFATGMTGYQETLTDPSYAGQIVVMTAPHIGNTGVNDTDPESRRIWVAGYVVRDASRVVSNHRAQGSLDDQLVADGIVGIRGIDTRAVTRRLREAGSMKGGVFSGPDADLDPAEQLALVTAGDDMRGLNLSSRVSTVEPYVLPAEGERIGSVAVLDLGVKTSTLRYLAQRGFEVHVLPQATTLDELRALAPDALFYSNGPGDPAASDAQVELLQGRCATACRTSASASATSSSVGPSGSAPTSCPSDTAGSTSRCSTRRPTASRSPVRTTASPSTPPSRACSTRPPASAASRSATTA
nr:hypothetical protein GCM10025699_52820 [Microbacterium flavescens]